MQEASGQAEPGEPGLQGGALQCLPILPRQRDIGRDQLVLRARCAAHGGIPLRAAMTGSDHKRPSYLRAHRFQSVQKRRIVPVGSAAKSALASAREFTHGEMWPAPVTGKRRFGGLTGGIQHDRECGQRAQPVGQIPLFQCEISDMLVDKQTREVGMTPVCMVLGAGAGIGGTVGKKFAQEGYHAALCRRSDEDGLNRLVNDIKAEGGQATGFLMNAVEDNAIEDRIAHIEANIGPIEVVIYNLGAQIGNRPLEDTTHRAFELGWRLATFGLFRLAKVLCPLMEDRGGGKILVTSATAAMRGNKGQHSHAAAMAGRRMLCQTLNAQYASKGIHVAHILVDGAVDAPDTLGKLLGPEQFQKLRETRGAGGRPASAGKSRRDLLPYRRAAPLCLDPRTGPALLVRHRLVEPRIGCVSGGAVSAFGH